MALHLYATVADLREHAALRGVSLPSSDSAVQRFIVLAQDYIDTVFSFKGAAVFDNSAFPRSGLDGFADDTVPPAIKRATLFAATHLAEGLDFLQGARPEAQVKREVVSASKIETEYATDYKASPVKSFIVLDDVLFILQRSGLLVGLSASMNLWALRG